MKVPPRTAAPWQTPLYQQYWALKDQVPDCILLFRLGDFFELFGDDAVLAAPIMEVQLTSRDRSELPIPMCGVPYHAWEAYAEKLLAQGLKIALTEQVELADKSKKLVDRRLTRVLTPGLPIDPQRLNAKEFHYLCALAENVAGDALEIYFLDFLGRRVYGGELCDFEKIANLLATTRPREIIYSNELDLDDERLAFLQAWNKQLSPWKHGSCLFMLKDYLAYTQRWTHPQAEEFLPAPESLSAFTGSAHDANISAQVLEQWDVQPHLFELLDGCGSAGGSRELRRILAHPLARPAHIRARQAFVRTVPVADVLEVTRDLYDLERLVGRVAIRAARPVELLRVRDSLNVLRRFDELLAQDWARPLVELAALEGLPAWSDQREEVLQLADEFARTLCDAKSGNPDCRELICAGVDPAFDECRDFYSNLEGWLQQFEES